LATIEAERDSPARLASEPTQPEEELNAELLAQAEYIVRWGEWPPRDGMSSPFLKAKVELAAKHAAEYIRLKKEQKDG
jgi:hypothetical protein